MEYQFLSRNWFFQVLWLKGMLCDWHLLRLLAAHHRSFLVSEGPWLRLGQSSQGLLLISLCFDLQRGNFHVLFKSLDHLRKLILQSSILSIKGIKVIRLLLFDMISTLSYLLLHSLVLDLSEFAFCSDLVRSLVCRIRLNDKWTLQETSLSVVFRSSRDRREGRQILTPCEPELFLLGIRF